MKVYELIEKLSEIEPKDLDVVAGDDQEYIVETIRVIKDSSGVFVLLS